jgi:hypothetical protein
MNQLQLKIKFVVLFTLFIIISNAQGDSTLIKKHPPQQHPKSFKDKMFVGGNLGFQFGTITFADISPLVGYRITDRISAGVGVTYQYYHYQDKYYNFQTNVYGGRVFGRYMFTKNIFGHVEYEYLNLEAYDFFPYRRVGVENLMGGGGFIQRFGHNSGLEALILYNFTESAYTPYSNPIFRVGVIFGL